jgi:hypothetical protein
MQANDPNRRLIDECRHDHITAQAASTARLEALKSEVAVLKIQVSTFERELLERVQRLEFIPIKMIVYALTGGILSTVLAAILAKVLIK